MNINLEAQARIDELESLLEEAYVVIDLANADRDEWKERAKVIEGQYKLLLSDYRIADVI